MSADRPLSARYGEFVFSNKPWSPTVGQVIALIEISKCKPVQADLAEALTVSFPQQIGKITRTLLKPFNDASVENRHAIKEALSQIVSFNIVNTPDYVSTQELEEARTNLLALAVAQVGLELMSEI